VVVGVGDLIRFDVIDTTSRGFCIPNATDFDLINHRYIIPVTGYYSFSYSAFVTTNADVRLAIMLNGTIRLGISGRGGNTSENRSVQAFCNASDYVHVECIFGSCTIFMQKDFCWFEAWQLK
jgi:hypothetical protein